jgi:hypothetical protein
MVEQSGQVAKREGNYMKFLRKKAIKALHDAKSDYSLNGELNIRIRDRWENRDQPLQRKLEMMRNRDAKNIWREAEKVEEGTEFP